MPLSKIKKALKWICNKLKRSQSEIDEKLDDEENNHLNHTNEQERMVIYENKQMRDLHKVAESIIRDPVTNHFVFEKTNEGQISEQVIRRVISGQYFNYKIEPFE